jgi:HAD superfamily hydrolase (TIGR01509 family)
MKLDIPDRDFGGYIFDCDGTLADTMPLHFRAWTRLVAELGGSFPEEAFYLTGGRPTAQILAMLRDEQGLRVDDLAGCAERKEEYFLEMIQEVKPIQAVVDVARGLAGKKPMAVASGGYRKQIEQTLQVLDIRSLFAAVVCAEDYARGKPFPDPFLEAARQLGVQAAECLVFEDSPLGIEAADAAGMAWVLVPR